MYDMAEDNAKTKFTEVSVEKTALSCKIMQKNLP